MLSLKIRRCWLQAAASLFVFTALVLGALAGCPQGEENNADTPPSPVNLSGQITVFGAPTDTGYVVSVYDYSAVIEDAAKLEMFTALLSPVATGIGIPGVSGISIITLEIVDTKGADFTFDGAFLVVIKAASGESGVTRYQSAVPFVGGTAILDYGNMQGEPKQEEPVTVVYTVTFDLNYTGAVNPPPKQEVDEGGTALRPSPDPVPALAGYTFGGWFTTDGKEWDFNNPIVSNLTLYAKWMQDMYTVRFDLAYFDAPAPEEQKVIVGGLAVRSPDPARAGYTFEGWFKELTETGEAWNFANAVPSNITLYAKWTPIKYTVSFNTGEGGSAISTQTVAHGSVATRPTSEPTRAGYTFGGWYADSVLTVPFDFTVAITGNTVVYAKWTPTTPTT